MVRNFRAHKEADHERGACVHSSRSDTDSNWLRHLFFVLAHQFLSSPFRQSKTQQLDDYGSVDPNHYSCLRDLGQYPEHGIEGYICLPVYPNMGVLKLTHRCQDVHFFFFVCKRFYGTYAHTPLPALTRTHQV